MDSLKSVLKQKRYEIFLFAVWSILTLSAASSHEPWRDEVQAFLIARDLSVPEIFEQMKYEGHFLLWFLVLKPFTLFGVESLSYVSWGLTAVALAVFLFYAPFSRIFKAVVCFSSPVLFWYPVVSRCYALIPPLLFLIAVAFPKRKDHPFLYGLLIALLANTHIIAEGVVLFLFLHCIYENWRNRCWICRSLIAPCIIFGGVVIGFITTVRSLFYPASIPPLAKSLFSELLFFLNCFVTREHNIPYELFHDHTFPIMILSGVLLIYLKRTLWLMILVTVLTVVSVAVNGIVSTECFILLLLCVAVFGKKGAFFLIGVILNVLWLFLTIKTLCSVLPQRALFVLFLLVFYAWIACLNMQEQQPCLKAHLARRFSKDMLPLFLVTLTSGGFLLHSDLFKPFSSIQNCGRFVAVLPEEYRICALTMDDGLTALSAWTKRKIYLHPVQKECTFYPRQYTADMELSLSSMKNFLQIPGKKVIVSRNTHPEIAGLLRKLSYIKMYETATPFAVPTEKCSVYVHYSNVAELRDFLRSTFKK